MQRRVGRGRVEGRPLGLHDVRMLHHPLRRDREREDDVPLGSTWREAFGIRGLDPMNRRWRRRVRDLRRRRPLREKEQSRNAREGNARAPRATRPHHEKRSHFNIRDSVQWAGTLSRHDSDVYAFDGRMQAPPSDLSKAACRFVSRSSIEGRRCCPFTSSEGQLSAGRSSLRASRSLKSRVGSLHRSGHRPASGAGEVR